MVTQDTNTCSSFTYYNSYITCFFLNVGANRLIFVTCMNQRERTLFAGNKKIKMMLLSLSWSNSSPNLKPVLAVAQDKYSSLCTIS